MMKKAFTLLVCCVIVLGIYYYFALNRIKVRNAKPAGNNIICFGDSLTAGTGATEGMDYPSQLSKKIGKEVINAGISGDTTARALSRLDQDVLSMSPRIVLITLGGNDLKNGVPKDTAFRNLKTIIEAIQAKGALVVVGGVDIPFWGRGFGDGYQNLCRDTGAVLIPNIFDGIMGNSRLMSDSIHPNDAGYAIMAERFYEAMKPYL
ncbi:MAG: arylesterase [Deltaproteobacteria bacterium]|nr:arylesterase [Deltaproteobacteria bacterium]